MSRFITLFLVLPLLLAGCDRDNLDETRRVTETRKCLNCDRQFEIVYNISNNAPAGCAVYEKKGGLQEIPCHVLFIPGADGIFVRVTWECPWCNSPNNIQRKDF